MHHQITLPDGVLPVDPERALTLCAGAVNGDTFPRLVYVKHSVAPLSTEKHNGFERFCLQVASWAGERATTSVHRHRKRCGSVRSRLHETLGRATFDRKNNCFDTLSSKTRSPWCPGCLMWALNLNFCEPLSIDLLVYGLRMGPSTSTFVGPRPQLLRTPLSRFASLWFYGLCMGPSTSTFVGPQPQIL